MPGFLARPDLSEDGGLVALVAGFVLFFPLSAIVPVGRLRFGEAGFSSTAGATVGLAALWLLLSSSAKLVVTNFSSCSGSGTA